MKHEELTVGRTVWFQVPGLHVTLSDPLTVLDVDDREVKEGGPLWVRCSNKYGKSRWYNAYSLSPVEKRAKHSAIPAQRTEAQA